MNVTSNAALAYAAVQQFAGTDSTAERARQAAEDYEAFFVAQSFEEMFAGIDSDPLFGGGEGENIFRSFLIQEYGKQVARAGGVGIAEAIQRHLLHLQEV